MNEFLNQIKNTPDLSSLFESIQKDASSNAHAAFGGAFAGDANAMDLS